MTEKNGRDADLDPQRFAPRVVPIRGFTLPAPPGWKEDREAEILASKLAADAILGPDDYTWDNKLRCTYNKSNGERCNNALIKGTDGCRFHNAKYDRVDANPNKIDDSAEVHVSRGSGKSAGADSKAERAERVRSFLEQVAMSAVMAVQSVIEDDYAKASDRLKAAEIVLDRTIGRQLQVTTEDAAERDLDIEILELADTYLPATGTDTTKP